MLFFSAIIWSVENIGASPSGKATDSDSVITGVRIPVPQPKKNERNFVPLILFCFVLHDENPLATRLRSFCTSNS